VAADAGKLKTFCAMTKVMDAAGEKEDPKLDAQIGKRMSVTGLTLGKGGADGLNVSTVNRVGETCP
jgi:hypothetical protein